MTWPPSDGWEVGAAYEDFMGRWSRPLAERFVRWLDLPPGGHWLDVGTGTGALVAASWYWIRPRRFATESGR
jgi:methylase of polypeptide subunit release factors